MLGLSAFSECYLKCSSTEQHFMWTMRIDQLSIFKPGDLRSGVSIYMAVQLGGFVDQDNSFLRHIVVCSSYGRRY